LTQDFARSNFGITTGRYGMSPINEATIPGMLLKGVECFGPSPWMSYMGEVQTFSDLGQRAHAIAAGLHVLGIAPSERVGLFLGNRFEWLQIEFGITSLGAWLVPINTMLRGRELEYVVAQSKMSTLIWSGEILGHDTKPLLASIVPELSEEVPGNWRSPTFPALRTVVGIGPGPWPQGVISWESFLEEGLNVDQRTIANRMEHIEPGDTALMLYTSGTTGSPKGALLCHGAVVDHVGVWAAHLDLNPEDRSILASPLFWSFGCTINALLPMFVGSMIVLEERFEATQFMSDLVSYGCTHLQGVPTQYELALSHPESALYDLSGIRLVQIGGSSSAEGLVKRLVERMPRARFLSSYGLTEAVGVNTFTDLGDSLEDVTGTVGHAAEDNEIELRESETGEVVATGEIGEIWIRGKPLFSGYFENPEATAASLKDGWLRTGDLAVGDRRGYLSIVGRNADAYKRGGMNVYPAEVEGVLQDHSEIAQVAVIGIPDPIMGEVGMAFIVPEPGGNLREDDVFAYCQARLAAYKVPSVLQLISELPLTPTGKVQKFKLRQQWISGQ
jgi:acyl-CoA synthetase (AMP-forming)/AMP-acid ligase II